TARMDKFNKNLLLTLAISIGAGIILSHFFSRRLHRPVKKIIDAVKYDQKENLGSAISEFNIIHDKIHSLMEERERVQSELTNRTSLLTNYSYINKLKMIRSDIHELQEFIQTNRHFRIVLFHMHY